MPPRPICSRVAAHRCAVTVTAMDTSRRVDPLATRNQTPSFEDLVAILMSMDEAAFQSSIKMDPRVLLVTVRTVSRVDATTSPMVVTPV